MKIFSSFILVLVLLCSAYAIFFLPAAGQAQLLNLSDMGNSMQNTGGVAGYGTGAGNDLPTLIGRIIGIVLGFLGVVLVIMIIIGGVYWMTAGGDEDKVKKGQAYLRNGIIGLAITLAAYAISSFVVTQLVSAMQQGSGSGPSI